MDKPVVCIQTFKDNGCNFSLERTLEALRPEYVILYHSDIAAVRQIELFESRKQPEEPASKVYFLIHDKTVEEQAYLTSLKREKQAFELLIHTKSVSSKRNQDLFTYIHTFPYFQYHSLNNFETQYSYFIKYFR